MIRILILTSVLFSLPAGCTRASDVQDALDAYHVVADVSGSGTTALSSRALAVAGGAGTSVRVLAALTPGGARAVVIERSLDRAGVLAWSIELRPSSEPGSILRLASLDCEAARAALPSLPPCPPLPKSTAPLVPEVVERVVYPRQ
jgi:hypothetical protein